MIGLERSRVSGHECSSPHRCVVCAQHRRLPQHGCFSVTGALLGLRFMHSLIVGPQVPHVLPDDQDIVNKT